MHGQVLYMIDLFVNVSIQNVCFTCGCGVCLCVCVCVRVSVRVRTRGCGAAAGIGVLKIQNLGRISCQRAFVGEAAIKSSTYDVRWWGGVVLNRNRACPLMHARCIPDPL